MTSPFFAAGLLLDRVNTHIKEFRDGVADFVREPNYFFFTEQDEKTDEVLCKIQFVSPVPPRLNVVAKDAITNIRDLLDNAVYASIIASGVAITNKREIKFPFGDKAPQVKKAIHQNIHPDIADLLIRQHPEARTKNSLGTLNHLANSQKHRWDIAPFPILAGNQFKVGGGYLAIVGGWNPVHEWDGSKCELTYLRLGRGSKGYANVDIPLSVSFNQPEEITTVPALQILRRFRDEANTIFMAIEAECRRLKWIP